jgi:hypothetical protein
MWTLEWILKHANDNQTEIQGKWVPARPENYKKEYLLLWERFYRAWLVFIGKADCFMWPEGQ